MKTCEIPIKDGTTLSSAAHAAAGMLDEQENMETRILTTVSGEYVIQAHDRNEQVLRWIGMDRQITIILSPYSQGHVRIRTVCSRWLLSRGILFLTGLMVICWPLVVTTTAGVIRDCLLEKRIRRFLQGKSPPGKTGCLPRVDAGPQNR